MCTAVIRFLRNFRITLFKIWARNVFASFTAGELEFCFYLLGYAYISLHCNKQFYADFNTLQTVDAYRNRTPRLYSINGKKKVAVSEYATFPASKGNTKLSKKNFSAKPPSIYVKLPSEIHL